ncbi:MAG: acetylornithine/succinylornithine family transaminase [Myxococcales bacterium]|nr:acetylornithine/succinylornithine family transaminase [Myxococcales bacterium]
MTREAELVATASRYLYPNYRQPPLVIERGKGLELWDKSGKRYLDMHGGIAVSTLGHAHPRLVEAISKQAAEVIHLSNYFYNEPNILLAERLCRLTGMARAFFCNSGAEAMEGMLKLARRHFFSRNEPDRYRVIAFDNSFHGRTLGALAATGQKKYRDGFGPLPGITHVPYGDAAAVRAAMGPDVAGILFEPVQGEGGVLPAPAGFVAELRRIADEHGALLLADEIQTGIGRTGKFLAVQHDGVVPDAVCLAKGLAGGVPIGSMLCLAHLENVLPPGSHGSTFGGNPLASAAALAVLDTLETEHIIDNVNARGDELSAGLSRLAKTHERLITTSRGRGLLQALILRDGIDPRAILEQLRDAGLLLSIAGAAGLRFSPPLVATKANLEEALGIVDRVLGAQP